MSKCCQYGVWPNCCNECQFCLREERIPYKLKEQLYKLERIKENILHIDWKDEFSAGISLLGGELYHITNKDLQNSFLELIDIIIENVLKASPTCKYSTVTNGLYQPAFLYKVIDKIVNTVGIERVDLSFSYDLKYRFKSEDDAKLALKNINDFHNRYNYVTNVQMILTQHVINLWKEGKFDINTFVEENIPGNFLSFLYPHPIHTGFILPDFNFNRKDFLEFLTYMRNRNYPTYLSFIHSVKNSATFKHTGLQEPTADPKLDKPKLTNGKEVLNPKCGHSILYKCYADTDKCMLCDLLQCDKDSFL